MLKRLCCTIIERTYMGFTSIKLRAGIDITFRQSLNDGDLEKA